MEILTPVTQDELIENLIDIGINVRQYSKPNDIGSPASFFISGLPDATGIYVKKGIGVKIEMATDPEHRQAGS